MCLDRCFLELTKKPLYCSTLACDSIREGNESKYKKPLSFLEPQLELKMLRNFTVSCLFYVLEIFSCNGGDTRQREAGCGNDAVVEVSERHRLYFLSEDS